MGETIGCGMFLLRAALCFAAMICVTIAPACAVGRATGVLSEQAAAAMDAPCHDKDTAPGEDVGIDCAVLCGVFLASAVAVVAPAFDEADFDWSSVRFVGGAPSPPAPPPRCAPL